MGQAWDKELSAEHSKLFSDWCSELREIRTMSINRLYSENGCTNLRLHIFTDASEEAMYIVAYLQDEATLKLTYVIGKCRVAPIRHMTISKLELQAAVYGVCLRKQILNEHDVRIDKIFHWTDSPTVLQWLQAAHKKQQVFVANRAAEIRKFIDVSMETRQRCRKPCRHWIPRNVHRRPQGVRMAKLIGMAPGR